MPGSHSSVPITIVSLDRAHGSTFALQQAAELQTRCGCPCDAFHYDRLIDGGRALGGDTVGEDQNFVLLASIRAELYTYRKSKVNSCNHKAC